MRILFLSVSGGLGGSERVLLDAVAALRTARSEWRVRVLSLQDGPLRAEVQRLGAEFDVLPLPSALAFTGEFGRHAARTMLRLALASVPLVPYLLRLRSALRAWAPDVVHANGIKADVLGALAAPASARLLWHVHDYVGTRRVSSTLLRVLAWRANAAIANSRSVAADLRSVLGARTTVHTVLNGVDTERFRPDGTRADLDALAGLPAAHRGTLRVGLVATYAVWKGHEVFLRALAAMPASLHVRGYVVGGPQYQVDGSQYTREQIEEIARSLGLSGRVGFVPFQAETPEVYRALDVVVHASTRPEPFGLTIAEALASGRAVISAAAGGALELGADGTSALRHAPGDARQLAEQVRRLAENETLRQRLGAAGRHFAVEHLSLERFTRELLEVYA